MKYVSLFTFMAVAGLIVHARANTDNVQTLFGREVTIQYDNDTETVEVMLDMEEEDGGDIDDVDARTTDDVNADDINLDRVLKEDELLFEQEENNTPENAERCPCSRPQQQVQPSNQQSIYTRPAQTFYPRPRPMQPSQPVYPAYPSRPSR